MLGLKRLNKDGMQEEIDKRAAFFVGLVEGHYTNIYSGTIYTNATSWPMSHLVVAFNFDAERGSPLGNTFKGKLYRHEMAGPEIVARIEGFLANQSRLISPLINFGELEKRVFSEQEPSDFPEKFARKVYFLTLEPDKRREYINSLAEFRYSGHEFGREDSRGKVPGEGKGLEYRGGIIQLYTKRLDSPEYRMDPSKWTVQENLLWTLRKIG